MNHANNFANGTEPMKVMAKCKLCRRVVIDRIMLSEHEKKEFQERKRLNVIHPCENEESDVAIFVPKAASVRDTRLLSLALEKDTVVFSGCFGGEDCSCIPEKFKIYLK